MERKLDEMLVGAERMRIVQLLTAAEGWRLVRAWPVDDAEGGWEVQALPVVCWALTHRTTEDGIVDHGVEAVVCDEGVVLSPHHEIDHVIDFLAPGVAFAPDVLRANLEQQRRS